MNRNQPPSAGADQTQAYSGYFKRDVPEEDRELTHVGPGTPGGEYLRRFWHPVAMASELTDVPLAVRILGEDLVLIKSLQGEIGLLNRHCSHRGASLEYGRITNEGVQCCYHGWHFAVDGRILETPGEPPDSQLKNRVMHGAYPTAEYKGLIFAYMGPPDEQPVLPVYDTFEASDTEWATLSSHFPCNWLQIHENCMDPFHATWLHGLHGRAQLGGPAWGAMPIMQWRETPVGMTCASTRRAGQNVWVSQVDCIMPNLRQTGFWEDGVSTKSFARSALSVWIVPIDDTNSTMIGYRFFNDKSDPNRLGRKELCGKESADFDGQSGGRPYREQQEDPNDWEANTSQRPIAVHALEHRASTDRGVAMVRRKLRQNIEDVVNGKGVKHPALNAQNLIPTYVNDTVLCIPSQQDENDEQDMTLLQKVGDEIVDIVVSSDYCYKSDRDKIIEDNHFALEHKYKI